MSARMLIGIHEYAARVAEPRDFSPFERVPTLKTNTMHHRNASRYSYRTDKYPNRKIKI